MTSPTSEPVERAQRKLREAAFFLDHMKAEDQPTQGNSEVFGYYTSAFLSAAQSSYYVLRDHGGAATRDRVDRWRQRLDSGQAALLSFLANRRNGEVHEFGFQRVRTVTIELPARYFTRGEPEAATPPSGMEPARTVGRWRFDERLDGKQLEVVPACERFLGLGHQLVAVCQEEDAPT